ncbi:deoxycytidylate deaminase [Streptomyces phage Goby]|uniref:Deoxycytidylate deaminase n=4 Tax=Likavirus TaxID=1982880 RepID=R4TMS1_9CAUD|nr:dCMP deaminase [Streptomyces phage Lika]YP_008051437.1 dCMP deaminase [Streptomyces phage Sujidade]YP_010056587.1 dCMP deaminase [Streptomyces phage Goby]AOQ27011.1 deoxycytidylate deaminase [Streptomyces phage Godpower]AWN07629.1 deoxycytidylate deaminase [Streptomyces phage Toma]AGM12057.1 deoxycytidylate deaminase [Streptomyces phage Lika]AGM12133.1 deoxycytidylate deaminase [Streptomyces phage Sujidade]AWN07553.1 deoxycytidylate deaminase [Streptomyces phage Goby]
MKRPTRDEWALGIAEAVATIADCTRAQVGAIIVAKRGHSVLGLGYNGLPSGIPGCATAGNCPRGQLTPEECARDSDYSNCSATHAERNAIEDALAKGVHPDALKESTLYVTRKPCPACTTLINSCGIGRVVVRGEENTECSPLEGLWRSMQSRVVNSLA